MANVIDVDFVKLHPPKSGDEVLQEIEAESVRAHLESMRATIIVPALAILFTAGLLAYALVAEAWLR